MQGLEKIWIVGDKFCKTTYRQNYQQINPDAANSDRFYAFSSFEVCDFFSSSFTSHNRSCAGRIINNLIKALNEFNTLPKLVVCVLDNDLVRNIDNGKNMYSRVKRLAKWLMKEFTKAVDIYKDFIPSKAKREKFPQFLWIEPPLHENFRDNAKRKALSECLTNQAKFHHNTTVLKLVKIWSSDDLNNFDYETNRFTAEGLANYWWSVDSAIRYWNVAIYPKIGKQPQKNSNFNKKKLD